MTASLDVLKALRARIVELEVPDPQRLFELSNAVTQAESAAIHGRWMRERPQDYSLMMLARTEPGFHLPATVYLQALNARPRLTEEFIAQSSARWTCCTRRSCRCPCRRSMKRRPGKRATCSR